MHHVILETKDYISVGGNVQRVRLSFDKPVSSSQMDKIEQDAMCCYAHPNRTSALIINVFETED